MSDHHATPALPVGGSSHPWGHAPITHCFWTIIITETRMPDASDADKDDLDPVGEPVALPALLNPPRWRGGLAEGRP